MRSLVALSGLALVVSFFTPWIHMSGFSLATSGINTWLQLAAWALPICGLSLIGAALIGGRAFKLAAFSSAAYAALYTLYATTRVFFAITQWGLWIAIAAIVLGVIALVLLKKKG